MRYLKILIAIIPLSFIYGCPSIHIEKIKPEQYLGYRPIDPIPISTVFVYDENTKKDTDITWSAIKNSKLKRSLLPNQSAQISVSKYNTSGQISYLGSSISAEAGSYEVIMDYMKYRVEYIFDSTKTYIGSGRIGVGLRIKALVSTLQANLNLSSLGAIGAEAKNGTLTGGISVDIIGMDSESITNLVPLTSEIDQTSIQSALQALASIKAKLWDDSTIITPHLIAIRQARENKESLIREKFLVRSSGFAKTEYSVFLRNYWKPDGKSVNEEHERKLLEWMASNGLSTNPGDITMFLFSKELEELREKAVSDLNIPVK